MIYSLVTLFFFFLFTSQRATALSSSDNASPDMVLKWESLHLKLMADSGPFLSPPMIARAYSIVSTCIYDTWAAYDSSAVPVFDNGIGDRKARRDSDVDTAISYAAFRCLSKIFEDRPTQLQELTSEFTTAGFDPDVTSTSLSSPAGVGNAVAEAVLSFRVSDGANMEGDEAGTKTGAAKYSDYTNFAPANAAQPSPTLTGNCSLVNRNRWQPLTVPQLDGTIRRQTWASPFCARVTPFASVTAEEYISLVPGPPLLGTATDAEYVRQFTEVLTTSGQLGDLQKIIAEFWADGPGTAAPPGHWHRIAIEAVENEKLKRGDAVILLFAQSNAVFEGGLAAWSIKRFWDSVRPITAVQCLSTGQTVQAWLGPYLGVGSRDGATWQPYQEIDFVTPPFAEYVSGHSTFSSSSAFILRKFFGDDKFRANKPVKFAPGSSLFEPKRVAGESGFVSGLTDVPNTGAASRGYSPASEITLTWDTWTEAAQEAGISRLFGGIHMEAGNLDGLKLGKLVGKRVWVRVQQLVRGQSSAQTSL